MLARTGPWTNLGMHLGSESCKYPHVVYNFLCGLMVGREHELSPTTTSSFSYSVSPFREGREGFCGFLFFFYLFIFFYFSGFL